VSDIPSLSYSQIIKALNRLGFIIVRQKGRHIRLQKRIDGRTIKIAIPAHKPLNPITLRHILKQADISLIDFKSFI
jgi:predicted RNA binding protein YcfA (HicA-like mRNA interferase family)